MRKIKFFLMLSLIVIFSVGVFVGCTVTAGVDPELTPHKVTYCANGGNMSSDAESVIVERYFYMQHGVLALEPKEEGSLIKQVTSNKYKFLGWAKAKVDANGNPVLKSEPVSKTDGGVWINKDGAISPSVAAKDSTAELKYYDYDPSDLWDFSRDLVTEHVVLVAVWSDYNKFIIAEKGNDGEWNDYTDLLEGNVVENAELAAKYEGKLYDVTQKNGTRITDSEVGAAYGGVKTEGHSLIGYYADPEFTTEYELPYDVVDTITIIYPREVEGNYTRVDNVKALQNAFATNRNVFMVKDIDLEEASLGLNFSTYSGTIQGNGYKLDNVKTVVTQRKCAEGEENVYGGIFGELNGAKIYNLTINAHVVFEIAINPDPNAKENKGTFRDATCTLGLLAKTMTGCTLDNVTLNVEYQVTHALVKAGAEHIGGGEYVDVYEPNDYEVEVTVVVDEWAAATEDNTIGDNCSLAVDEYQEPADDSVEE